MHRRIAEQIQSVVRNAPWADKAEVYIHTTDTDGFWKVVVRTSAKNTSYLAHVKHFSQAIGQAYGEGLGFEEQVGWLVLS